MGDDDKLADDLIPGSLKKLVVSGQH